MNKLYEIYMENMDYFTEAESDPNSNYLERNLQTIVDEKMKDPNTLKGILSHIQDYLGRHTDALSAPGPMYDMPFTTKDIQVYYNLFELDSSILISNFNNVIKEAYGGQGNFDMIKKSPHKLLFVSMLMNALKTNNEDLRKACTFLFAFADYQILFKNSWRYGVKADVMEYTIEHLSNQFKIRQFQNVLGWLYYNANRVIETRYKRLLTRVDIEYFGTIGAVRNILNSAFKNIAEEYYANYKKDATSHTQTDEFDDGQLNLGEGNLNKLSSIVDIT